MNPPMEGQTDVKWELFWCALSNLMTNFSLIELIRKLMVQYITLINHFTLDFEVYQKLIEKEGKIIFLEAFLKEQDFYLKCTAFGA